MESVNPLTNRRVTWSGKINIKKIVGSTNLKFTSQIKGNKTNDCDFCKLIIPVGTRKYFGYSFWAPKTVAASTAHSVYTSTLHHTACRVDVADELL